MAPPSMVSSAASPAADRALDDAIRQIPSSWFRPRPVIYWLDLALSAGIGWSAFAVLVFGSGWVRFLLAPVGLFALYRAVLFIHEITHLSARDVPAFKAIWNVLVGVPLLIPSFLYEGVHTDHHRQNCYGTDADPEYMPFGHRGPHLIVEWGLASLLVPLAFGVRFAILTPISYVIPAVRRFALEHCSALAINPRYVRRVPITTAGRIEEAAACAFTWTLVYLWWSGSMPASIFAYWLVAVSAASGINAFRTFAAHRYDVEAHELSGLEQLLDSVTIGSAGQPKARWLDAGRALVAPVGLRYHALHHWIPAIPYHNLGRVHRLLISTQTSEAPYRTTLNAGFIPVLRDLFRRSRAQSGAPRPPTPISSPM